MRAAETLDKRGHHVTLVEREDGARRPGQPHPEDAGSRDVRVACATTSSASMRKRGVDIRLGTRGDAGAVAEIGADGVVLATGAVPSRSGFSIVNPLVERASGRPLRSTSSRLGRAHRVPAGRQARRRARRRRSPLRRRGLRGAARPRARVEVVSRFNALFPQTFYNLDQATLYGRLLLEGAPRPAELVGEGDRRRERAAVQPLHGRARGVLEGVDTVVLATGPKANDELYFAAQGHGREPAPDRRLRRAAQARPCDLRGRARRPGAVEPGGALHLRGRAGARGRGGASPRLALVVRRSRA